MAIRRQFPALLSDPGHRHLDPRRRVYRRDPRLLFLQAARRTATRPRPSGPPAIWSWPPLNIARPHGVPGFPTARKSGAGEARAARAATASSCGARGKRASMSRRAHRLRGANRGLSSNSTLPAATTSAATTLTTVSDNLIPRLRYAYGTLGGFLAGQANSNFSDPDANPETLDFGGPPASPG